MQYRARTFVSGGPTGYQEVEEAEFLHEFDIRGRVCFPAGLLARVKRTLREHGYRLRIDDQRKPGPRLSIDENVLNGEDSRHKALLQAIAREALGQIETVTEEDIITKMLLVGDLSPKARFVVAVATRREAWKLWRNLQKKLNTKVGLVFSNVRRKGRRWLVGTFGSIPRKQAGKFDILLLPSAEEAIGNRAIDLLTTMEFRRTYAIIQPQRRPDRLVQLRLEAMAGPIIHRVKKPRAAVRVLMLPTPSSTIGKLTTALERKRSLYWHNDKRNDFVAQIANAVMAGDRLALKEIGLRNQDIRLLKDMGKNRIAVLVESPEYGREILSRLPSWHLHDLVPREEAQEHSNSATIKRPAVVTTAYATLRPKCGSCAAAWLLPSAAENINPARNGLFGSIKHQARGNG